MQDSQQLYTLLKLSKDELNLIVRNIHENYKPHSQPKIKFGKYQIDDNGKIRLRNLLIPSDGLKASQKKINELLQKIKLPEYMYGCVPGKNHVLNASHHLNQSYFLTIDLKNFFTNINHKQVFSMFLKHEFSPSTSRLLTKLSTYNGALPQGSPSSPVIANLVFLETADKLAKLAKEYNLRFSCFLDDLSFSSDYPFKKLVPDILNVIREGGFLPSQTKIHYQVGKCEITGLVVNNNRLEVIKKMRKRAKTKPGLYRYVHSIDLFNKRNLKK